jgi:thiamine-monophosphate kinase
LAVELFEGMLPLAQRYDVAIAGGDTNSWDGPLAISVTAIGQTTPRGPLRRDAAKPGDSIIVTGSFGGSILGKHLDFEPRVEEALLLAEKYELHAGIDVSDGLSTDLAHIVQESNCGAVVQLDDVPIAEAAVELASAAGDSKTPLDRALSDGEDFELILAVPQAEADRLLNDQPLDALLTRIGQFVKEPGLWQEDAAGRRVLEPRGYEHNLS